ncbi:MAG: trimethylamine methyltransferase family protein [Candidatus Bathyarchaeota archaeon]|nr:trimethylamine methyltransferase family protein [Candidatus Bathyarchaeota archaeon]
MEYKGGRFSVLTQDQLYDIHMATLEVLEKTGVLVKEKNALNLLKDAGATVDEENQRAYIPQYLVEEAIQKTPKTIKLCGRDPKNNLRVEGNRSYFGLGGSGIYMLDPDTLERRTATKQDLIDSTRLADSLENIDFLMGLIIPQDIDQTIWDRYSAEVKLKNTMKHCFTGALGEDGARDVLKMASLVAGGEEELVKSPLFSFILCTVSPLTHDERNTETAMELARHKAPIIFACESICGGTAPISLAGTLVLQNAEVLSATLIAQLTNPGTPVIYGAVSSPMDMRNGSIVMGVPEVALMGVAVSQLAQYYGIPLYSMAGITDSKVPDAQASYEKALQQVLVGFTGGNLIHNAAGMLDKMITGSLEQMVIDNEIIGMVKRIMRGIEVNTDTLAADVIDKVGPGGHFLGEKHTRRLYRSEHDLSVLSDRLTREAWEKAGRKDVLVRAKEMVKQKLENHQVEPLDADVSKEMDRIILEAKARYSQ